MSAQGTLNSVLCPEQSDISLQDGSSSLTLLKPLPQVFPTHLPVRLRAPLDSGLEYSEDFGAFESREFVANPDLRRRVCRAMFLTLSENGFAPPEARKCALRLEQQLRRQDPSMTEEYRNLYRNMTQKQGQPSRNISVIEAYVPY